ncbi:S8 family peptidase [Flavilitoribacter nigricans]|uniref:Protease n=1 Tax=Flavilitoribacter nigricans (strain ATCC 23147 / DSM 23189 / NBRC 102662 / NCIMB 1420 / SS-2) TaxID=1122177 RepID=A0A2D0N3A0_FLAN2|nr:S8 family serine peptidase [Flavilitoribacter nigricans]PHN02984.1 protease [Flavilitoribacter nigricans DSM 23189 = NBRC 102662]
MKLKNVLIALLAGCILASCAKEDLQISQPDPDQEPLSRQEINEKVEQEIIRQQSVFRWGQAEEQLLWSAVVQSDSTISIGYQPAGFENIKERIHEINLQNQNWKQARENIIRTALSGLPGVSRNDILLQEDQDLPILLLKLSDRTAIARLRALPEVRYLEPANYQPEEIARRSDSGCDVVPASSIPTADYTTVSPNVKVPWNFYNANIPAAWNTSTGAGIKVALIDTGTSPNQSKLGSAFNSGQSQGRTISRKGTYVSSWWWWASPDGPDDQCGHGTQMAGLIAAPRGSGGATVGVAYNCNLLAIRGTGDVVVNGGSEKDGVKDALVIAGKDSGVKIISMSIGDVFWSDTVADGIYYAYNRGKLIFAAAGTSLSWTSWYGVIFPANMAETVAVTGVRDGSSLSRCNTCHSGSEVDFVAVMQRSSDNSRTSLTLAPSGNTPAYVGGSSAATATTAGIAALVWATNPGQSRNQVLNRMKNASQFYPSRNSEFGWGLIDAAQAVN